MSIQRVLVPAILILLAPSIFADDALRAAIEAGDGAAVARCLAAERAIADQPFADGKTPLSLAVGAGHAEVVAQLLAAGADPNRDFGSSECAATPLQLAVLYHRADLAAALLTAGARPDAPLYGGTMTALTLAIQEGQAPIVAVLLDAKASTALQAPLVGAVGRGELAMVTALLDHGASPDQADAGGMHALHAAATAELAACLIERGAAVDVADSTGATPLLRAADAGRLDVVRQLLGRGASAVARDRAGLLPIDAAIRRGAAEIVALLVDRVAPVDPAALAALGRVDELRVALVDRAGANALSAAGEPLIAIGARFGQFAVCDLLLSLGADVDARAKIGDSFGYSALHEATRRGDLPVTRLLLDRGADVDIVAGHGERPLHLAAGAGATDVVRLLMHHGADYDAMLAGNLYVGSDWTPLHYAITGGPLHRGVLARARRDIVARLVAAGADVSDDLLDLAAERDAWDVVSLLLEGSFATPSEATIARAERAGRRELAKQLRRRLEGGC